MAAGHQDQWSGSGNAVKVPAVKPYFWVVKLLTTAMGEAVSDYLVNDVNKYGAVALGFVLFVLAMVWQFRTPTYRTWPYWSAVAMVAVFGTMCADVLHIVIGLPLNRLLIPRARAARSPALPPKARPEPATATGCTRKRLTHRHWLSGEIGRASCRERVLVAV